MGIWNELNDNVRQSSRRWLDWARKHAQDIGDAGMRHIERQDLLSERKQLHRRLGEIVAERFVGQGRKTVRADAADISEITGRIEAIDQRLDVLDDADESERRDQPRGG